MSDATGGARSSAPRVVVTEDGVVQRYYGVPLDLTLTQLASMPLKSKVTIETGDEALSYPVATITAHRGVRVRAEFGRDGQLYRFETSTANALGVRGIRVGSTLADLQRAFPDRKPYWGMTPHDQYYATFDTGTSMTFHFSPLDLPRDAWARGPKDFELPATLQVKKITIKPIRFARNKP